MKIMPLYINQQQTTNNNNFYQKFPISNISIAVNQDNFTYITKTQQRKFSLAFGNIPEKEIYALCDGITEKVKTISNLDDMQEIQNFVDKLYAFFEKSIDYRIPINYCFTDELGNVHNTFYQYLCLALQKQNLSGDIQDRFNKVMPFTKECTHKWSVLEQLVESPNNSLSVQEVFSSIVKILNPANPGHKLMNAQFINEYIRIKAINDVQKILHDTGKIPIQNVFESLKKILKTTKHSDIQIEGEELIEGKKADCYEIYNSIFDSFSKAIELSDGKPFKLLIEESIQNGQKSYYAAYRDTKTGAAIGNHTKIEGIE